MEELDTKEKILRGAETLFMRYGVRSISMDDIARHLSVSKKTLYQHFADKEDIVTMVAREHMQRSKEEFDEIKASSANAIDELARISVAMKKHMEEMNPTLLFDLEKYHPRAWAAWQDYKVKCIADSVQRNLQQGIDEGFFRAEINAEIMSIVRMALIEIAFDDRTFPQHKFRIPEVQMQIFEHFVYGVVTDKGRKLYEKYKQNLTETITR
jgi:TetR/AcrR family transcriptional regulator, cholesterol catabolism regulator